MRKRFLFRSVEFQKFILVGRIACILFCCFFCPVLSQTNPLIEDLHRKSKIAKEDSVKVSILNDLGDQLLLLGQFKEANNHIVTALQLAEKLKFKQGIARSQNLMGIVFIYLGDYKKATGYLESALSTAEEINLMPVIARVNLNLGTILSNYGDLEKARDHYTVAANIYEKISDELGLGKVLLSMANLQDQSGDHKSALKNYEKLIEVSQKIGIMQFSLAGHNGVGNILKNQARYEEALQHYEIAYDIAEQLGRVAGFSSIKSNMALIYNLQGKHREALAVLESCLALNIETGNKEGIAVSNLNIGGTHRELGNYAKALEYFNKSLTLYKEMGDAEGIREVLEGIGIVHIIIGNYPKALTHLFEAEKIIRETNNSPEGLADTYAEIGNVYFYMNNYEEAIAYQNKAKIIYSQVNNTFKLTNVLHNLASYYTKKGDYQNGLVLYHEALENANAGQLIPLKASILGNMAAAYIEMKHFDKALPYCMEALQINEKNEDRVGLASNYNNLAMIYMETGQYDKARSCQDQALKISLELGRKSIIADAYRNLSYLNSRTNDFEKALEYQLLYTIYRDSLLNETSNEAVAELRVLHEIEKKDFDIQQLEKEKQISSLQLKVQESSIRQFQLEQDRARTSSLLQRRQIDLLNNESKLQQTQLSWNAAELESQKAAMHIKEDSLKLLEREGEIHQLKLKSKTALANYLMGAFLVLCLVGFMAYKQYHTRQQLKLQKLRNKIASDLHDDVGSTLSSISIFSEMAQQQSKEVQPLLQTIHTSSRNMLEAMADIVWTINPENDQFEKIVMRMRNFAFELLGAKQIDFEFNADEEINRMKLPMDIRKNLYLIFKEATNNLVKYSEASEAEFTLKNDQDKVVLMIRDNGKGFDPSLPSEGNGIKSMRKRAADMGADFLLKSIPGEGTLIELKVAV